MRTRILFFFVGAVLLFGVGSLAQKTSKPKSLHVDLSKEKAGKDSSKFLSVVGNWSKLSPASFA